MTCIQPALEFEKRHQLSGIGHTYQLPAEYSSPEVLEAKVSEICAKCKDTLKALANHDSVDPQTVNNLLTEAHKILAPIEALNPIIEEIVFDRNIPHDVLDVLSGVASGFNVGDISYFIRRTHALEKISPDDPDPCQTFLKNSAEERETVKLLKPITAALNLGNVPSLGWVASVPTLNKIWGQLRSRGEVVEPDSLVR